MDTINNLLKELDACKEAKEWAVGKTWQEIFDTCHRGDWLLWLFAKTNPDDLQLLILAKGHCANTVRHLMQDERSIAAVDAAIAYGEGKITIEELKADAAYAAYYAYVAATAAVYAGKKSKEENQMATANICRQYLPIEIWKITFDKQN